METLNKSLVFFIRVHQIPFQYAKSVSLNDRVRESTMKTKMKEEDRILYTHIYSHRKKKRKKNKSVERSSVLVFIMIILFLACVHGKTVASCHIILIAYQWKDVFHGLWPLNLASYSFWWLVAKNALCHRQFKWFGFLVSFFRFFFSLLLLLGFFPYSIFIHIFPLEMDFNAQ